MTYLKTFFISAFVITGFIVPVFAADNNVVVRVTVPEKNYLKPLCEGALGVVNDYREVTDKLSEPNVEYIQMAVLTFGNHVNLVRVQYHDNKTAKLLSAEGMYRPWHTEGDIPNPIHEPDVVKVEIPFDVAMEIRKIFVKELQEVQKENNCSRTGGITYIFSSELPESKGLIAETWNPHGRGRMEYLADLGIELNNFIGADEAKQKEIIEKINGLIKKLK